MQNENKGTETTMVVNGKEVKFKIVPTKEPEEPTKKPQVIPDLNTPDIKIPKGEDMSAVLRELELSGVPYASVVSRVDPKISYIMNDSCEVYVIPTDRLLYLLTDTINTTYELLTQAKIDLHSINATAATYAVGCIDNIDECIYEGLALEATEVETWEDAEANLKPLQASALQDMNKAVYPYYEGIYPDEYDDWQNSFGYEGEEEEQPCWYRGCLDYIGADSIIPRLDHSGKNTAEKFPLYDFQSINIKGLIANITDELNGLYADGTLSMYGMDAKDIKDRHLKLPTYLYLAILRIFNTKLTNDDTGISLEPYLQTSQAPWLDDDCDTLAYQISKYLLPKALTGKEATVHTRAAFYKSIETIHHSIDAAIVKTVNEVS